MDFYEDKPNYKLKLYSLLIYTKNKNYSSIIAKMKPEIYNIIEKDPSLLIFLLNSEFNHFQFIGEELFIHAIKITQQNYETINETSLYKIAFISVQTKQMYKLWVSFFENPNTSIHLKFYKFIEQFLAVKNLNVYQFQLFFYVMHTTKKEFLNFQKALRMIFYSKTFLIKLIDNEIFHATFFNILQEIVNKSDPHAFFIINSILLKLDNYGLKSFELIINLKILFEFLMKFPIHQKKSEIDKVSVTYFLMKNGIYSLIGIKTLFEDSKCKIS